jgi:hypothetical protein
METLELIAILTVIVEAIKRTNKIPNEYLPFLAMILGIAFSFLSGTTGSIGTVILLGIIIGLSSVGLFENVSKGRTILRGTEK